MLPANLLQARLVRLIAEIGDEEERAGGRGAGVGSQSLDQDLTIFIVNNSF